ncbi:MAG: hypothetical protein RLZZ136_711 [Pseudomonadota bacterium]|jgi:SH3-like domain-containing protein
MVHRSRIVSLLALMFFMLSSSSAWAEDPKVPFWAAIRAREVNMRVGPGDAYRVIWVYHRPLLPVKVLRSMDNWWLVQDPDGARGWVLSSLMTKKRGAIVRSAAPTEMHEKPDPASHLMWRLTPGISGRLGDCEAGWCHFEIDPAHAGWVRQADRWGAGDL